MSLSSLQSLKQELPYRWKVQSAEVSGCECVAYIDARQVMDLLDEVLGPENWQDHYREVAGKVYCDLSIRIDGEWITKADCADDGSGAASEAFKRAAVKWGIGRFLFGLETIRLNSVAAGVDALGQPCFVPADDKGRRIYHLTAYIHSLRQPHEGATPEQKDAIRALCQELGWSAEQLRKHLHKYQTSWKDLSRLQATRLLDSLSRLARPDLDSLAS